ncbi:g patch domain and kow motifs-containing [Stylonychia lemnae]|uniref:G patch domain and kow motifs-containing n=1 Tax=Stylonychia lemnae TaxID=5949 RepID=A0A078ABB1_STYLE|nr:g patch domain and kow motifs-containing [Stylonychia lemnae]|eukprot:CDW79585.1 g patch domain and kow motifs-containing [Stylonychia lemnae]
MSSSEVAIQRIDNQTTNPDRTYFNQSTNDTTNQSPQNEQIDTNTTDNAQTDVSFSHLFPAHLYLNRGRDNQSGSHLNSHQFELPKQNAYIGKDMDEDAYDRMPIENFGKSVLAKLGWSEGIILGRTSQNGKIVQPIDYMPRQHRLGLGARPLTKEQLKKMGDDYDKRKLAVTEDYTQLEGAEGKNFKSIHTQLKQREKMQIGSIVCITGGTHKGLEGKIIALSDPKKGLRQQQKVMGEEVNDEIDGDAYVSVELALNQTLINVKRKRIVLRSENRQLEQFQKENDKEDQDKNNKMKNNYEKFSKSNKRSRSRSYDNRRNRKDQNKNFKKLKWILPGLIVRVISKKIEEGKLYNTKLKVTDVLNESRFLAVPLQADSSSKRVYDDLREKDLETVLPRDLNEPVAVLKGEFRGETGKILSKDKKKDQVVIQVGLTDIVTVSQDDCCQISNQD